MPVSINLHFSQAINAILNVQDTDSNTISITGFFDSGCNLGDIKTTNSPPPQASQSSDAMASGSTKSNHHNAGKITGIVIGTLIGALLVAFFVLSSEKPYFAKQH
ncbi:hypothetical protein V5O48_016285 [Marasmius crinis-equi]|uniref:Mid2 domain-containing protein n=1 Tax=Marasmius crinis-equi TaxID=585013 RepID=A0ABR3ES75_9AGAR